jgi:ribosome-associated toxin RatA of RatAB toxin-antitoxin module
MTEMNGGSRQEQARGQEDNPAELAVINDSREIRSPLLRVWEVVADVDNDPAFWKLLKSIKNISRVGNTIRREVTVGFRNSKGEQLVVLNPEKSIEVTMTAGPIKGTRVTTLSPLAPDRTRVDITWSFALGDAPSFAHKMIERQIERGTERALEKTAEATETTQGPAREIGQALGAHPPVAPKDSS